MVNMKKLNPKEFIKKIMKQGDIKAVIRKAWAIKKEYGYISLLITLKDYLSVLIVNNKAAFDELGSEYAKIKSFNVVPYYIDYNPVNQMNINKNIGVAIHLHLFYTEMIDMIIEHLNNMPLRYDLYVSCPNTGVKEKIESILSKRLIEARNVFVVEVPNRGRDFAPLIIEFGDALVKYDCFAHIHTKKSPHSEELQDWMDSILNSLFGSKNTVKQIINLLTNDARVVYPAPNLKILIDSSGWSSNYKIAKKIIKKYFKEDISKYPYIEFPQGSMFWAKSDALKELLKLPLTYADFPEEPISIDGTLAHVLERVVLIAANKYQGRNYRIYTHETAVKGPYFETQQDYSNKIAKRSIKVLSLYLPHFYSKPENDTWYEKGFTEWTNVCRANPLFFDHRKPNIPHDDIGYYELTTKGVMKKQAEMMKKAGVYGQIFYHYWFKGKQIFEKPAQLVLSDQDIDMPFCFCWKNENWIKKFNDNEDELLLEQQYSEKDAADFIKYLIPFFQDSRYIKIDGRPMLFIFHPSSMTDLLQYLSIWKNICHKNSMPPPFVVGMFDGGSKTPIDFGMDAGCERVLQDWEKVNFRDVKETLYTYRPIHGSVLNYSDVANYYMSQNSIRDYIYFRSIISSYDNTPGYGGEASIIDQSTPKKFQEWLECLIKDTENRLHGDHKMVVVNAWNGWAESAYLEPDNKFGYAYLNSIGRALSDIKFDSREYLHQNIPESIQLEIEVTAKLLEKLKRLPDERKKMLFCLTKSSVLSNCQISCRQKDFKGWLDVYALPVSKKPKKITYNYTLRLLDICYFGSDSIENMLKMALFFDAGVIVPTVKNSEGFTHLCLGPRWEVENTGTYMFLYKNNYKRSIKCCVDTNIFLTKPYRYNQISAISTIIRFPENGDMLMLRDALFSLLAQSFNNVQPIIAVEDLSAEKYEGLNNLLASIPWPEKNQPLVHNYTQINEDQDSGSNSLSNLLQHVQTRFVTFLDYHNILFCDAYEWLTERLLNTNKAVSFGSIFAIVYNRENQKIMSRKSDLIKIKGYDDFMSGNFFPSHGFMVDLSKIDLKNITDYPDMKYLDDYLLSSQFLSRRNADWKALTFEKYIGDYYCLEGRLKS